MADQNWPDRGLAGQSPKYNKTIFTHIGQILLPKCKETSQLVKRPISDLGLNTYILQGSCLSVFIFYFTLLQYDLITAFFFYPYNTVEF